MYAVSNLQPVGLLLLADAASGAGGIAESETGMLHC